MNRGLVNLKELRELKNKADFRGKSAYCFIAKNKIIKIYATKDDRGYVYINPSKIYDFSKYKADTIVFPSEYIYEKKEKCGEIQDYIKDSSITHSFNDSTKVYPLLNNYDLVLQDMFTYNNIVMIDLCSSNILYSNENGFHIIDTTEWQITDNYTKGNIFRFNSYIIRVLMEYLDIPITYYNRYSFIDEKITNNCNKYGRSGYELNNLIERNINDEYHVIDLFYAYMNLYQKIYNQNIKNLEDMKELTKILKKG